MGMSSAVVFGIVTGVVVVSAFLLVVICLLCVERFAPEGCTGSHDEENIGASGAEVAAETRRSQRQRERRERKAESIGERVFSNEHRAFRA